PLARRQQPELALGLVALEVVQALDPQRDGLEVREQAAEPAVVDVGHAGVLRDLLDGVARLLLGAHEQHRAAAMGDLGAELLRLLEQRLGLEQVDDVDAAALTEDEAACGTALDSPTSGGTVRAAREWGRPGRAAPLRSNPPVRARARGPAAAAS